MKIPNDVDLNFFESEVLFSLSICDYFLSAIFFHGLPKALQFLRSKKKDFYRTIVFLRKAS